MGPTSVSQISNFDFKVLTQLTLNQQLWIEQKIVNILFLFDQKVVIQSHLFSLDIFITLFCLLFVLFHFIFKLLFNSFDFMFIINLFIFYYLVQLFLYIIDSHQSNPFHYFTFVLIILIVFYRCHILIIVNHFDISLLLGVFL
jgi:hypothetical protein